MKLLLYEKQWLFTRSVKQLSPTAMLGWYSISSILIVDHVSFKQKIINLMSFER